MNGFYLLKNNDLQSYLGVLDRRESYDDGDRLCIDIENGSADVTLMFIKPMDIPNRNQLGALIGDVIELDEFVACRDHSKEYYLGTGSEFQISYVEIENSSALTMYYCGVNVNTQWGARFSKDESGQWVFGGLC